MADFTINSLAPSTLADTDTFIKSNTDGVLTKITGSELKNSFFSAAGNTGFHNSIFRGKFLGTSVTDAQWSAISAGTFDDLFIGDYWTINDRDWHIAAFNYYYGTGDNACTTHHVVIVPGTILYSYAMNDTDTTTGAYVGSKLYSEGLNQAKTMINNAFGSSHILEHRNFLKNAVASGGYESDGAWYNSTVELMTEQNLYGCKILGNCLTSTGVIPSNSTVDNTQFPLFALNHSRIRIDAWYWLRDVVSQQSFAIVPLSGRADHYPATGQCGIRPSFCIKA